MCTSEVHVVILTPEQLPTLDVKMVFLRHLLSTCKSTYFEGNHLFAGLARWDQNIGRFSINLEGS